MERDGGFPDEGLIRPSQVSSRFSRVFDTLQTAFGLGTAFPDVYTEEEFEGEGWWHNVPMEREDVVGTVDVTEPLAVLGQYSGKIPLMSVGALSDDGLGEAPSDFVGLGEAQGCLSWVARAAELEEWKTSLGEFGGLNSFSTL